MRPRESRTQETHLVLDSTAGLRSDHRARGSSGFGLILQIRIEKIRQRDCERIRNFYKCSYRGISLATFQIRQITALN